MIYLKLDRDENLSVTQMDRLFYYDPLSEQIQFLVPKSVGESYSYSAAYQTDDAPKQLAPLSRNASDYNQDYMILNFHDDAMLEQRCGKLSISLIAVDDSTGEAVVASNHASEDGSKSINTNRHAILILQNREPHEQDVLGC